MNISSNFLSKLDTVIQPTILSVLKVSKAIPVTGREGP
jgi:hypothetical protein